jgi:membrane protein DedA with SNARE-associated domain/rhodanese-related sulfurtransferase
MMGASSLDTTALVGTAVAASLLADIVWFWNGRRNGRRILRALCKLSMSPDSCVRQTESLFAKFGVWSLLFAKFFPGMTNITVALAGVTKTPALLFLLLDTIGAALFVSVPIGLGWIFRDAIADMLATIADLGLIGILALLTALGLYLAVKWWQRRTFIRQLRMDRISIDQLAALIDGGKDPLILDVRPAEVRRQEGIIPGAVPAHPGDAGTALEGYSRDREVVVYCSCPNEASAAIACLHLRRAGFTKIRPLAGGTDAWVQSGRSLQMGMFGLV